MEQNLTTFLTGVNNFNRGCRVAKLDDTRNGFIVPPDTIPNHKQFRFVFIPSALIGNFTARFSNLTQIINEPLQNKLLGIITSVNEYQNFREAILKVPLAFFINTSFARFLEQYVGIKMTSDCYIYCSVTANHPLFNYLDVGNRFLTKFYLEPNGLVTTKIGKAKAGYQYISIFDADIVIENYGEHHFTLPIKKKSKEISEVFGDVAEAGREIYYKNTDINLIQETGNLNPTTSLLFEVDRTTAYDLAHIPKLELLSYSKITENTNLSRQILIRLPDLKDDEFIELPTKLKIGAKKVVYSDQELESSIITPEDFIFNTKRTFPSFNLNELSEKHLYTPVTAESPVDTLDWDRYLSAFLVYHWIKATQYNTITLRLGNINVTLNYIPEKHLFYINGYRINKNEVPEVLGRALCYRDQAIYNDILAVISKTSLEMHRFIESGLLFQLNLNKLPEFANTKHAFLKDQRYFDISFRIVRIKNTNYIEVFDKKKPDQQYGDLVKIRDSRALMKLQNKIVNWDEFSEHFGAKTKVLEKEVDLQINGAELLKQAIDRYVQAFNKSRALLNEAISETKSKIITFHNNKGILVEGSSGTEYFIKVTNLDNPLKGDPECSVAHYPSNTHICIVDKHGTGKQTGLDPVVARIYALKNDSVLAEHIHTIKSYVQH